MAWGGMGAEGSTAQQQQRQHLHLHLQAACGSTPYSPTPLRAAASGGSAALWRRSHSTKSTMAVLRHILGGTGRPRVAQQGSGSWRGRGG